MPWRSLYNKEHPLVLPRKKSRKREAEILAVNGTMLVKQNAGSKLYQVFDGKVFIKAYKTQRWAERRIGL